MTAKRRRSLANRCLYVSMLIRVAYEKSEHVRIDMTWLREAFSTRGLN